MSDDFKHAKITGQDMRDHWGPIVDRIADEISDPRDARIKALTAENERLRAKLRYQSERYFSLVDAAAERANALTAENERLRNVLRYYVDKDDYGERARAALGDTQ